ncbi:hypothetical protein PM082_011545 [Marasmius tenuissimus]|nr:hypothetical protein PM082_011545 [Marasmius tenuissimus]
MPKVTNSSTTNNTVRLDAASVCRAASEIQVPTKVNEQIIKARLAHLRRVTNLPLVPSQPMAMSGSIVNEGMYLSTGSRGVRSTNDKRFINLGRWFWRVESAISNGKTKGKTWFEASRIPLDSLLADMELMRAIERRGLSLAPQVPPQPQHTVLQSSTSAASAVVDDDDIEYIGAHFSSDGLLTAFDGEDVIPDSDVTFVESSQSGEPPSEKGKSGVEGPIDDRLDVADDEIAFQTVIFGWVMNDNEPTRVTVPVLKTDGGFLSLRSIKHYLGSVGIEAGDTVERYSVSERAWKRLKWSIPFPVAQHTGIALRLPSVTAMKNWEDYRGHIFSL